MDLNSLPEFFLAVVAFTVTVFLGLLILTSYYKNGREKSL